MLHKTSAHNICLQVYDGYGHTHNLVTFGHVYIGKPAGERKYTTNIFANIRRLIRLFFIKPIPRAKVVLEWQGMTLETLTETDGFFKFEWESPQELAAGWHTGSVRLLGDDGVEIARQAGRVMVPHITQYGFISDIDDTVLVSHSATVLRRMKTLLTKHPHNRHSFAGVQAHYQALSVANTDADVPNPFFYVSSSEWNLFYDLKSFFHFNQLPQGVFLLNQIKRWYQLFGSGQTKHSGKLARIFRVMEAFPKQKFVLLGDNSQADPDIYAAIAKRFPERIFAIYIRNIRPSQFETTQQKLSLVQESGSTHTLLFDHSQDAIEHSRKIGLIG
jgi:phosphatidate phosphatase APP1